MKIAHGRTLLLAAGLVTQTYAASTFAIGEQIDLSSSNAPASDASFNISVNENYQGFKGDGNNSSGTLVSTNTTFNNPIEAYRFWHNPTSTTIGTLTQSGGLISDITTTDASYQIQSFANIWETTDPNGNLYSSTRDYAASVGNLDQGATGSIDISGMSAGSIYFFYGAYRSTASLSLAMTGSGSASDLTISELHNGDFANNNEFYVGRVDFVNEDGYSSIDWNLASGFNGRFSGIVVTTAVPEPSSLALLGLSGLALLRRRR